MDVFLPASSRSVDDIVPSPPGDAGAPLLHVRLAGGLALDFGNRPLALPNRKARALLAYLALDPAPSVSRERLAALFWADVPERQALASLRTALFELRGSLGAQADGILNVERGAVGLVHGRVRIDVQEALEAVARGVVPAMLLRPCASDTLLAGFDDAPAALAEWVRDVRQGTLEHMRAALEAGFERADLPQAARRALASACLRLEPAYEPACRAVMRLAAEAGDTAGALKAYTELYQLLDREFDTEPSDPTQALVADIKRGVLLPARVVAPASAAHAAPPPAPASAPREGVPRVAVLPLRSMGGAPVPPCFQDGLVDDVVRTLARLREPVVISSNSTRHLRGDDIDHGQAAAQLGVQYIVTGSVRMTPEGARIAVELSEVQGGAVLWGNAYNVAADRLFDTQDELAARIAHTFAPRVGAAELRMSRRRQPEDLDAYHLVLRARDAMFSLERAGFNEAAAMLRRAAVLDPGFPAVFASLASWHSLRLFQGWSDDPAADTDALVAHARAALRLEPGDGRMMALLGHVRTTTARHYLEALELFDTALELTPNDPEVMMLSSATCAYVGQGEEAVRRAQQAIALSPHDPFLYRLEHFCSLAHYAAGDLEQAAGWGRRSMGRNTKYVANLRLTAASLAGIGQLDAAREVAAAVLAAEPRFRVTGLLERQPFRDPLKRQQYVQQLLTAGLPP